MKKNIYRPTCAINRFFLRLMLLSIVALLGTTLPRAAWAQSAWQASYWNNQTLAGEPDLQRQELAIAYDWGFGSPDPQITPDQFSARWTRRETVAEGTHRFTVTVDDGIRIWVNGVRILDDWQVGARRTHTVDLYLDAGTYETRVEYFEAGGQAEVTVERTLLTDPSASTATPPIVVQPTATLSAPIVVTDPTADTGVWQAAYYNNPTLAGEPALTRTENNIDFRWGSRSPAPGQIGRDRFSARWTRTIDLEGGRYRFAVTADDGIRLYVNGRLLINEWHDQAATTYTVEEDIAAGPTDIRIDYYENADQATARFSYAKVLDDTSPSTPSTPPVPTMMQQANWRGEYFDNVTLSGEPLFARDDNAIAFDWGNGSPAPNQLGTDRFSIRWSDTLSLTPGTYRFVVTADDGVRLWINGELVVDQFTVQSARTHTVARSLPDGRAAIVMEYFENTGVATAQLAWQRIDDSAVERSTPTPVDPLTDVLAANPGSFSATVVNTSNLNVRRGPGVEYSIQTVLNQNQRVIVTGRNRTTAWVEIRFGNGERGWVNRRYLQSNNSYRTLPLAE